MAVVSAVIEDAVVVGGCGSSWRHLGDRSVISHTGTPQALGRAITPTAPTTHLNANCRKH